ncbi:unnamed protein product [Musa acuminata subsp. malaccensis]|uniref:(wild Malaysian banana) hypothetical protein n=1 Tax=Musa acuminata subsp. malaccensis TaxID=214687 RepID=A0A804JWA9_MUSAM|nr:unnamed protein product [Musa acuminata subsp. malaccensis]
MRTFLGYNESQSIIWRKLFSWITRKHMLTLMSIFSCANKSHREDICKTNPNPSMKYRNLYDEQRTSRHFDL